jgi:hypothetical protein
MKRTTKYVGLDVHQASTAASVREASGRIIARSVLPTEAGALTEFVRGMRGAVHLTFEEGTQAQWLHDLFAPLVDRVLVCDRRGAPRTGIRATRSMPISSPSYSGGVACARSIMAVRAAAERAVRALANGYGPDNGWVRAARHLADSLAR